jgi:L-lactate dehydrogenase complex protein LldG
MTMSARDVVLARVRGSQPAAEPLPPVPAFERADPAGRAEAFARALERMGGACVEAAAQPFIRERFPEARVVCSATPEVDGTRPLPPAHAAAELADVDVGVVRAAFGVAETGSVFLSEQELGVNALGFLPQHLVVLLDPAQIVPDLHAAYADRRFLRARYAVLLTGPSATADIEGVLVRGAQGVRSLTVLLDPAPGSEGSMRAASPAAT